MRRARSRSRVAPIVARSQCCAAVGRSRHEHVERVGMIAEGRRRGSAITPQPKPEGREEERRSDCLDERRRRDAEDRQARHRRAERGGQAPESPANIATVAPEMHTGRVSQQTVQSIAGPTRRAAQRFAARESGRIAAATAGILRIVRRRYIVAGALVIVAALAVAALVVRGGDPSPAGDIAGAQPAPRATDPGAGKAGVRITPNPKRELSVTTDGWRTDFTRHTVPLAEFLSGGPPKDGIPAVDRPRFVSVEEARPWLEGREPVIELAIGSERRAYPLQILIWHEIVNDRVGEVPVVVTFCPLCNTALAFDRRLRGRVLDFGTTGNLRHSDLVMYDRQTETWWQQFGGEAVVGALAGRRLRQLPATIVAFEDFAARNPRGSVLSRETGHNRRYGQNPYAGYDDVDSSPIFPAQNAADQRLQPKERVVFVERRGRALAVPFGLLRARGTIRTTLAGERLEFRWLPGVRSALDDAEIGSGREVGSARVRALPTRRAVPFDTPFWFAVAAFRENVTIVGDR